MAADTKHTLTAEETGWCRELKLAMVKEGVTLPEAGGDFLVAQFALIGKGKTDKALERVKNYNQHVIGTYNYSLDAAAAGPARAFFDKKFPGSMLPVPSIPRDGATVPCICTDVLMYEPGKLAGVEFDHLFTDMFLMFDAMNADLDDVRAGIMMVNQCKGMGWKNISLEIEKRAAPLYQNCYPMRFNVMPMVGAGPVLRIVLKIVRAFLSAKIKERLIVCSEEELYAEHGFAREQLPACLGGTCAPIPYEADLAARLARRDESVKKVRIP